jgi:hypothetical protein
MNFIYYNNEKIYYKNEGITPFKLDLYKHDENSDMRILIDTEPDYKISTNLSILWKDSICLSKVIVFRDITNNKDISLHEPIFLAILKINEFKNVIIELYSSTYEKIYEKVDKLSKTFILLDLDRTLILCSAEIETLQEKFYFKCDFSISNYTYSTFEEFNIDVMIRPGTKEFLEKLFKITDQIYIITAGDKNYAEEIVKKANKFWNVPIKHVFSMRSNDLKLKSFDCIIPFRLLKNSITFLAIDDNIDAWEKYDQSNVIQISPFNTIYTNKYDILRLLHFIV